MKKGLKITLSILALILIVVLGFFTYTLAVTAGAKLDDAKLINLDRSVAFFDVNNELINKTDSGNEITKLEDIPSHVVNAFIAIEDKRFYKHDGVDVKGLFRATFNNIKSFSFKEGASTISQQLIKNTHLTSEKTLNRKLIEIKLSKELEKRYSKSEIIEKYLNTIYFGDNCFGITKASKHYFDKNPNELSVAEGAALAGLIKSPSNYSPSAYSERCNQRKNVVLKEMFSQGFLSETEYQNAKSQTVTAKMSEQFREINFMDLAKKKLNVYLENNKIFSDSFNVYTSYLPEFQKILEERIIENLGDYLVKGIIINKNADVVAYFANCVDYRRQLGSTIKPLVSYAPAIENDLVDSFSILRDEKTDFNGYSPSNYNDIYAGDIPVKTALSKSSNVCAVKLLNYVGLDKAKNYLKNMQIPITENDNSLVLALGSTENGATINEITQAYSVFLNGGNFLSSDFINKISSKNGKIIGKQHKTVKKVFGSDTTCIINDMLNETATSGTAKKLSLSGVDLCGKTGTVGNENGNTDAYCISFNKDYILSVWIGNKDGTLLPNNITGGGLPAEISKQIWKDFYNGKEIPPAFETSLGVEEIKLDKISYDNSIIEIADEIAPARFVKTVLVKKSHYPIAKSKRFSSPKIETPKISVNNREILIELCLTEFYNVKVFRTFNGKKELIYDTKYRQDKKYIRDMVNSAGEYEYSVIPYYFDGKKDYYGEEIKLPKVMISNANINGNWWGDFFD